MLINATTAISTSSILLVPYSTHHVPTYHEWMKNEEIQQATASEPLTLEEEYSMQKSWREDADKLTFIACLPLPIPSSSSSLSSSPGLTVIPEEADAPNRMVGDVNLFLRFDEDNNDGDDNDDDSRDKVVGEIELMIAEKQNQGKGFGRAALLTFLRYIIDHEDGIVDEYLRAEGGKKVPSQKKISYLSVKIGQTNTRSVSLFESFGFTKVTEKPNYFGELELRRADLDKANLEQMFQEFAVRDYKQLHYRVAT